MFGRSISFVLLMMHALIFFTVPAEAALPGGLQDVYTIFTTGIGPLVQNSPYDYMGRDGGAYSSWSSTDFILTYDGGNVGDQPSPGIIIETPDYPPTGAFLTYSNSSTGIDTNLHWMKVAANNSTLGSFELTGLDIIGYDSDTYTINVIGTTLGGGTVQTGPVSYSFIASQERSIPLTNFSGQQITSFEVDFTCTSSPGRPADFMLHSFTVANSQAPVPAPTVTTGSASSITTTGAILNGTVNANGYSTTVTFDYGTTTSYGSTVTAAQSPVTGSTATSVSAAVSGLTCGTLYHFRAKGVNGGGTIYGGDQIFTTTSCNTVPTFVGATTTLTVVQNAGATDIKSLLHVSDTDSGQTETWSQSIAPNHGGTLAFSGATASSGSTDITPGGTITYQPAAGYSGTETFTVQVGDGTAIATRTITVTIVPPPTVTDANISIHGASGTGGAFKIGDNITATWNNTAGGDNNSGVTGVTVDFSQFGGGSAVAATNSSDTWTATYTITVGSIDATNRNVSVTAANSTASTTTADTSNATLDNIAPTVSSVSVPANSTYTTGQNLDFTVYWSENVIVAGIDSTLGLTIGGTVGTASYQAKAAATITYRYTVQSGDIDTDGVTVGLLTLNGSTMKDYVGNDAILTLNAVADTSGVRVDTLVPTAATATGITLTGFSANWGSVAGATGYRLDVATDSGFTAFAPGYNNLDVGNATTHAVTGLSASDTYYYRIRAYNSGGTSASSNTITVLPRYTVTPSTGGHGSISPDTPQTVIQAITATFNLVPETGYHIDSVGGTCGGTLDGGTFTTNPVTGDCTVEAVFAPTIQRTVSVTVAGSGAGAVYSDPAGIACSLGICSALFDDATTVTLTAVPDANSTFGGWSGACTSFAGVCELSTTADMSVTADFVASPKAEIGITGYDTLTEAYAASANGDVIKARSVEFIESLLFNRDIQVFFEGGYNAEYDCNTCGDKTVLNGSLTVGKGQMCVGNLTIK